MTNEMTEKFEALESRMEKLESRISTLTLESRMDTLKLKELYSNHGIETKPQVIDLSVLIESGIDCEFADDLDDPVEIGKISEIKDAEFAYLTTKCESVVREWKYCRPRMNYWHHNTGFDKCPIPEGFKVDVRFANGILVTNMDEYKKHRWSIHDFGPGDIIGFKIIGVADGYRMPWEQE